MAHMKGKRPVESNGLIPGIFAVVRLLGRMKRAWSKGMKNWTWHLNCLLIKFLLVISLHIKYTCICQKLIVHCDQKSVSLMMNNNTNIGYFNFECFSVSSNSFDIFGLNRISEYVHEALAIGCRRGHHFILSFVQQARFAVMGARRRLRPLDDRGPAGAVVDDWITRSKTRTLSSNQTPTFRHFTTEGTRDHLFGARFTNAAENKNEKIINNWKAEGRIQRQKDRRSMQHS